MSPQINFWLVLIKYYKILNSAGTCSFPSYLYWKLTIGFTLGKFGLLVSIGAPEFSKRRERYKKKKYEVYA